MDTINVLSMELRNKVKKEIIPGGWVEFYDDLTAETVFLAEEVQKNKDLSIQIDILVRGIASWNFAGDDGKILSVSNHSISLLPLSLLKKLIEEQSKVLAESQDKKKDLPET